MGDVGSSGVLARPGDGDAAIVDVAQHGARGLGRSGSGCRGSRCCS